MFNKASATLFRNFTPFSRNLLGVNKVRFSTNPNNDPFDGKTSSLNNAQQQIKAG